MMLTHGSRMACAQLALHFMLPQYIRQQNMAVVVVGDPSVQMDDLGWTDHLLIHVDAAASFL